MTLSNEAVTATVANTTIVEAEVVSVIFHCIRKRLDVYFDFMLTAMKTIVYVEKHHQDGENSSPPNSSRTHA